eukprot:14412_1
MSTHTFSLLEPDKFGLLVQCRQKMDKLAAPTLRQYGESILNILSTEQLKKLLFVGLNSIRNDIECVQLHQMRESVNQIIEEMDKQKKSKHKTKNENQPSIRIIPKNASLTEWIPFDIISHSICTFLKMSSITQLAQCDRQLAITCHTPTSISNLMHRHDVYRYDPHEDVAEGLIDGDYHDMNNWSFSTMHRFRNVEKLAISLEYLNRHPDLFNTILCKVKHLAFYDQYDGPSWSNEPQHERQPMPLLESISLVNGQDVSLVLQFLRQYQINLKSISFVDCHIPGLLSQYSAPVYAEYNRMVDFILPQQPNALEILKFENASFCKTDDPRCTATNDEFANINRIKSSLSNLKGFVYQEYITTNMYADSDDLYLPLCQNIMRNLSSFSKLESLHAHCLFDTESLNSLVSYIDVFMLNVTELCISVPFKQETPSILDRLPNNLEKLCLVVHVSSKDKIHTAWFKREVASILQSQIMLRVFQIVAVMAEDEDEDPSKSFCRKRLNVLTEFVKHMIQSLNDTRNQHADDTGYSKQSLLFRFHIKSCHRIATSDCQCTDVKVLDEFANTMQHFLVNYLITYPFGKIQVKLSWNADYHSLIGDKMKSHVRGLHGLFRVSVKEGGNKRRSADSCLRYDMDFVQYAICVDKKDVDTDGVRNQCMLNENKWRVDCRYCCNTAWL